MDEADPGRPGGPTPGERPPPTRKLERAPGERYAPPAESAPEADAPTPSRGRATLYGTVGAIIGALMLVVFGGLLEFDPGLIVVAFFLGRIVGLLVRTGAGPTMSGPARNSLAIVISLLAVVVGQIGIWGYSRFEGGSMAPVDYLLERFGGLAPLQLMVATISAWWSSR